MSEGGVSARAMWSNPFRVRDYLKTLLDCCEKMSGLRDLHMAPDISLRNVKYIWMKFLLPKSLKLLVHEAQVGSINITKKQLRFRNFKAY